MSSKEGILLKSCIPFLVDSPSGLVSSGFSFEINGAVRPPPTTESGRNTLMYTAATTATEVAT